MYHGNKWENGCDSKGSKGDNMIVLKTSGQCLVRFLFTLRLMSFFSLAISWSSRLRMSLLDDGLFGMVWDEFGTL